MKTKWNRRIKRGMERRQIVERERERGKEREKKREREREREWEN